MHTLRFLLLALITLASARAQEPQWIWHTDKSEDGEVRFFRKTFTLAEPATAAEVIVSGDNTAQVFINGTDVGTAKDWKQPARARVEKWLKAGENVIAIRGTNTDGVAAVIARLTIDTAKGKGALVIVTDTTWHSSEKVPAGWESPGFAAADWGKPMSRGKLGMEPWGNVFAGGGKPAGRAPATELKTPAGFKAELIRTAEPGEGSWVSMTVDPQNRLIVCSQNKPAPGWGGLLRLTLGADGKVEKTEKIESPIGEAMGLLWAFDSLYVDGNGPKGHGLYRLRFQNDQPTGEAEFLLKGAGGEHGSHGIVLGPDKALYSVAGNHTKMPGNLLPSGALKGWAEDHLLPRQWDAGGHATGVLAPGGYVLRSTDQGKTWATFCGSFRNSYDIAFNADGELFTFDSDMEWDIGTPWYRPTRINHCVSGGEYGWRSGTSNQPAYYFDSLPAACDIGIGSPTGCEFGTAAKGWPAKYQRALYAMDWANGKIFAYHPTAAGATYGGTAEVFVEGKPLNVTDLTFVNGVMYFTCGGRGTQAALYRVIRDPTASLSGPDSAPDAAAAKERELRHQLEAFHGKQDPKAVATAWPHLDSPDRFIRWAARTAIEFQPFESWKERALGEKRTWASLEAMLALVRSCPKDQAKTLSPHLCEGITTLRIEQMSEDQLLAAIRLTGLVFTRLGAPTEDERGQMTDLWTRFFPQKKAEAKDAPLNWIAPGPGQVRASQSVNRELCQLLVFLDAPGTVEKTMTLLRAAPGQEEQLHYAFVLRNGQQYASPGEKKPAGPLTGWTPQLRTEYFAWLAKAAAQYSGGASFKKFIANIKKDALETLSDADKLALADKPAAPVPPATGASPGHPRGFVKAWEMAELLPLVKDGKGDAAKGKKHFAEAQCALCHRFGTEGGALGPDLTAAGSRFNRRDMLEAIIDPNKVVSDQYRNSVITVKGGKEIIGRQVDDTATKIAIAENPFTNDRTEINKADITKRDLSPASSMPPGLINLFTKEEIIDLLTYLESGGK